MKVLNDSLGYSLEIGLGRQALEWSASKRHNRQVIRHRLNKVSNEVVKMGAGFPMKEIRRGSEQYIRDGKITEECTLRSTGHMCQAFRWHFESRFTKDPGFCDDEFRS